MLTMEPERKAWILIFFLTISLCGVKASSEGHHGEPQEGPVVKKDQRRTLLATEFGQITALDIKEEPDKLPYHLQFITLEPNSLFLPVLLHADMVFYVHTGSGKLTWAHDDDTGTIPLREGDLCNLVEGSVFYIQSDLEAERRKLRIYAMLTNTEDNTFNPSIGAYSRIDRLVKGFDKRIMQAALKVPDDLIEEIVNKKNTPAIVHADSKKTNIVKTLEASFLKNFVGVGSNSNKLEKYNILNHDPDFKNRYGSSVAVSKRQLKSLKRTNIGFLMVHLNEGSILGPHWNPKAAELAVAVEGKGMVRVVNGSSTEDETESQNMRFKVNAGDAFVVPRFHSMAQMAFNDEPFVFLGFSTSAKDNHPQFLAGKGSVLDNLDKHILATSLGVSDRTAEELQRSPRDAIIFGCSSCAEEEENTMEEEERERKREEEERKREEEEEDRKQEREREREEEEAKRQQEEREKKREEEEEREHEEGGGRGKERERKEEREREEEEARRQQEKREKKREKEKGEETEDKREQEKEQDQDKREGEREAEAAAQKEQEQARREQEKREKKRQEEGQREGKEEEDPTWWERPRREKGKRSSSEEEVAEEEQEQAKRQQEEREKRREQEGDADPFEGRRALKVRNV
ncbi:vicilin-like seed storage protein At2g18540 [Vigna unguiculata]|uniref:vicilin-like seed storage protein At2g18540 n=1 Tax=Vigna unguiculata TaxID=3917 RepID=UPI001016261E|nr:vicilin-like seed storage protein At2g18540 [Vigna unguiculata]